LLDLPSMPRMRLLLGAILSLAAASCLAAVEDETPPVPQRDPAGAEAPPFEPVRLRSWPKLDGWLRGQPVAAEPTTGQPLLLDEQLAARGKKLFDLYCWQCHGKEGRGDGPRSALFTPPPRNLTQGLYKFRSTPTGELPTREDLFRTISGGLRGTGMMPFADLPEAHRWALVAYVRSLAPRFVTKRAAEPIALPAPPPDLEDEARAERGRRKFTALGCFQCHGKGARGDGPRSGDLKDSRGFPIRPADFGTRPPKRGSSPLDYFLAPATGLDGTPMPSFEGVPASDLWDAVAFIRQVGEGRAGQVSERDREEARELMAAQAKQGRHAVVDGCGCQARRKQQAQ